MEFTLDDKCKNSFQMLKRALTTAPILKFPNMSKLFILNVDTSFSGIGYLLLQADDEGQEHPIEFGGRAWTSYE